MTAKQYRVLHYVRDHHARTGKVPGLRQACARLGFKHHHNIAQIYGALVKKGFMFNDGDGYYLAETCPCCGGGLAV